MPSHALRLLFALLLCAWVGTATAATLSGPPELYAGESKDYTLTLTVASSTGVRWSATGAGGVEFKDPSNSCGYGDTRNDSSPSSVTFTVTVLATKVGSVDIHAAYSDPAGNPCAPSEVVKSIKVLPKFEFPEKMPLGAKLRRVDIHGVPMADPGPTGEGEGDRIPNMAYTDMYDLSPKYAVTDIAVPVDGGELVLEFRRTMSLHSRNYNPDLTQLGITNPNEDLLGVGWNSNLGARIVLTTEQPKNSPILYVARVTDEVGNSYTYLANATFTTFTADTSNSFNNEAVKAALTKNADGTLALRRTHGTGLTFESPHLFHAPFSKADACGAPLILHDELHYRLRSVQDRNGNQLVYTYQTNTVTARGDDLICKQVAFVNAAHPEDTRRVILINASYHQPFDENLTKGIPTGLGWGWRVDSVVDALGSGAGDTNHRVDFAYTNQAAMLGLLTTVTKPPVENPAAVGGALVRPVVSFAYTNRDLSDVQLDITAPPHSPPGINRFVLPVAITDARGALRTTMTYQDDWMPTAIVQGLGAAIWQRRPYILSMATQQLSNGTWVAMDAPANFSFLNKFTINTAVTPAALTVKTSVTSSKGDQTTYDFTANCTPAPNRLGGAIAMVKQVRTSVGVASVTNGAVTFQWEGLYANGTLTPASGTDVRVGDVNGNLTRVTDLSGNVITYDYTSGDSTDAYDAPLHSGAYNSFSNPRHYQAENKPAKRVSDANVMQLATSYRYETGFNKELKETDAEGKVTTYVIDGKGNRTTVNEAVGTAVARSTLYAYDADGFVNKVTDPDGRVTTVTKAYAPTTPASYVTTTTTVVGFPATPLNLASSTVADAMGNVVKITDGRGAVTQKTYDNQHRCVSVLSPAVATLTSTSTTSTATTHYDYNSNAWYVTDDEGNATITTYDPMNRAVMVRRRMTNPASDDAANDLITTTHYNAVGQVDYSIDAKGYRTDFQYDRILRLTLKTFPSVTLPDATTVRYTESYAYGANAGSGAFTYWSGWQPTRVTDRRNNNIDTFYDGLYRTTRTIQRLLPATAYTAGPQTGEPTVEKTYNKLHKLVKQVTWVENFAGATANQTTYMSYDSLYRPTVVVVDADGTTPAPAAFVEAGLAFTTTSATALVTRTAYDHKGNATQVNVLQAGDNVGNTTVNTIDGDNRITKVQQPSVPLFDSSNYNTGTSISPVTSYAYDANGNKVLMTDANGTSTKMVYDARNRLTETSLDLNHNGTYGTTYNGIDPVTDYVFNLVGRTVKVTNSLGNLTVTAYDRAYRPVTQTQPAVANAENGGAATQPVIRTFYDHDGNVTSLQDARGVSTQTTYDELNRVRSVVQASGTVDALKTESQYDQNGNVLAMLLYNSAASGGTQTTSYGYDACNRKTTETLPSPDGVARISRWGYYRNGAVRTAQDPRGQVKETDYDRVGRVVTQRAKRSDATVEETRSYQYDRTGKIVHVNDLNGASAYAFDALLRQTSETRSDIGQNLYTVNSFYDAMGHRTKVVFPDTGRTVVSTYDRAQRLASVADGLNLTTFTWDVVNNRLTCTEPNGTVTTSHYDALNRMVDSATLKGSATVASYVWHFDLVGNRRDVTEVLAPVAPATVATTNVTTYAYDNQYRITGETLSGSARAYTYDLAGNRTSAGGVPSTYDLLNELTSVGSGQGATSYHYDLNGNLAGWGVIHQSAVPYLTWDTSNRLIESGYVLGPKIVLFAATYDYRSRRLTKGLPGTGGTLEATYFRYDGGVSFQELKANAIGVEFVRGVDAGGGIGSILYGDRSRSGGFMETFAYNPSVGHVVALTNPSGTVTATEHYDAFGAVLTSAGTTANNRLANTKERDAVNDGLVCDYHGFRYYCPAMGRYISRDPAGYPNGLNNYLYVNDNPINRIDPLGMGWWSDFVDVAKEYVSGVKEVFKGEAMAVVDAVKGVAQMAAHPINTAVALAHAAAHPVDTAKAIGADLAEKSQTLEGQGNIVGSILLTVATGGGGGAATKAGEVAAMVERVEEVAAITEKAAASVEKAAVTTEKAVASAEGEGGQALRGTCKGPPEGCFIAGTLISCEFGETEIQNIKVGDRVWAENPATGQVELKSVLQVFIHPVDAIVRVQFGDDVVCATISHPFWVIGRGWVGAASLREGDVVIKQTGDLQTVTGSCIVDLVQVPVYNFEVENDHTYFVGPDRILVHNMCETPTEGAADGGGGFRSQMDPETAARYDKYWQRESLPEQTPGTAETSRIKASSDGKTSYRLDDHYDEFGRQVGQTHYTDHPALRGYHPNPHHHVRDPKTGQWLKNPATGDRVWPGVHPNGR